MVGVCVQEKEMEKQKLLYQQARLHDRGAAEMVLQTISASKGEFHAPREFGSVICKCPLYAPGAPVVKFHLFSPHISSSWINQVT